jgi:hypothetical protein
MAKKTRAQEDLEELELIIEDMGLKGIIKAEPIENQVNLFVVNEKPGQFGMAHPIAGYDFAACLAFLRGYYFAKTGQRYQL